MYDPNIARTMTVAELVAKLQVVPQDGNVFWADIENGPMRVFPVFEVEVYFAEDDPSETMVALIG